MEGLVKTVPEVEKINTEATAKRYVSFAKYVQKYAELVKSKTRQGNESKLENIK